MQTKAIERTVLNVVPATYNSAAHIAQLKFVLAVAVNKAELTTSEIG
jgi:uncharacterized membrane protein